MSVQAVQRSRSHIIDSEPGPEREIRPRGTSAGIATTPGSRALAARTAWANASEIRNRLDEFRNAIGGPYRVGDAGSSPLWVDPPFRMQGGLNQLSAGKYLTKIQTALAPEAWKTIARDVGMVVVGKGSPDQIRRVTQALIDSAAFAGHPKTEAGIRKLMWDHGVGIDCSGYVHQAFLESRGGRSSYGLGKVETSGLQRMRQSSAFRSVSPSEARSGDVIVLEPPKNDAGHKVVVYDRTLVAPGSDLHRAIARELGSKPDAKIHVLQVDSSWGAGGRWNTGGVQRKLWAFDESSGRWATLSARDRGNYQATASAASGPYDHALEGVYRPRAER